MAGKGKEVMVTSLVMIGSGLLGPAFGPLIVGMIGDAVTAVRISNRLALEMLTAPVASVLTAITMLIATQHIAVSLRRRCDRYQRSKEWFPLS